MYTQRSTVSKGLGGIAMDVDNCGERGQFLSMFRTYVTRSWDGVSTVTTGYTQRQPSRHLARAALSQCSRTKKAAARWICSSAAAAFVAIPTSHWIKISLRPANLVDMFLELHGRSGNSNAVVGSWYIQQGLGKVA